jgi:alpha,alpha-trehalase
MIREILLLSTLVAPLAIHASSLAPAVETGARSAAPAQLDALFAYIKRGWTTLSRSPKALAQAAADSKVEQGARALVYVPAGESVEKIAGTLKESMSPEELARIELRALPKDGAVPERQGLLYLPHPYVVPGGRFNEMYGWDSYFILVGLLRDGEIALAKGMTDNFLYEVERYGKVLNANRTYYLTRSQPPFLTEMVLGVYAKTGDKAWLKAAVPALESYHAFWTGGGHLAGAAGLSRYYDAGEGPAPEALSERDADGRTHYDRVKEFLKKNPIPGYDLARQYDAGKDELTPFFYKNDRSMRESGFDPSDRFGPFNSEVVDVAPVCLNSLLYRFETELGEIQALLGEPAQAVRWKRIAAARKKTINALMWDEKDGLYYDYDAAAKKRRPYPFATTFYPLWAGIADAARAARVRANLPMLERAGGLMTSVRETGKQWDAPFGWAPMQMIAVGGLRRYGFAMDADRIAVNFLSMILNDFLEHNVVVEKYDVVRRRSSVASGIKFGYSSNEIGFGWTNAAVVELYAGLGKDARAAVLRLDGLPVPAASR